MKKYYVGFAVLLVICVGALVYAVGQGGNAKTDAATSKVVEQMGNTFDEGDIGYNKPVPASLADAGIKNVPSTVTYTKINDSKYKVCFDYKQTAGGFDASWTGLFYGGNTTPTDSNYDYGAGDGYFDSSVEFTHKKGENCQTVTTDYGQYSSSDNYLGNGTGTSSGNYCSYDSSGTYVGYFVIKSVDTTNKTMTLNTGDTDSAPSSSAAGQTSNRAYDSSTVFCDQNFLKTDVSALAAGDQVTIYQKSATDTTVSEIDINSTLSTSTN